MMMIDEDGVIFIVQQWPWKSAQLKVIFVRNKNKHNSDIIMIRVSDKVLIIISHPITMNHCVWFYGGGDKIVSERRGGAFLTRDFPQSGVSSKRITFQDFMPRFCLSALSALRSEVSLFVETIRKLRVPQRSVFFDLSDFPPDLPKPTAESLV